MTDARNMIGVFEKLQSCNLFVHQHRCVRVRNRNASCRKCADACTSGCISFEEGEIVIDQEKCIGCGTCSTACPTCALEPNHPSDSELLRQARDVMRATGGEVVIASERVLSARVGSFDLAKVVSVSNVGRVEETLLVTLASEGATCITIVWPEEGDSAEIKGMESAQMVCESANCILETWNSACRVFLSKSLPEWLQAADAQGDGACPSEAMPDELGKASSENGISGVSETLAAPSVSQHLRVMGDGTIPHFIPDRRERLLNALYDMGEPSDEVLETRLWGHVVINRDMCVGCRMCATFCPTGAIYKFCDEDGTTGIEHASADCVKCRCCEDICPARALVLSDVVQAKTLLSGDVDRYEMTPEELRRTNSRSIVNAMRNLIGSDCVFER